MTTNYKQSRWTKVHEQGKANFTTQNNVMDITVGSNRAQAEVLYSTKVVRSFEKAAYWLLRSLGTAHADEAVAMASDGINAKVAEASRDDEQVVAEGEGWFCTIERVGEGEFKAQLTWTFEAGSEQLPVEEQKPAPKKRGRKKKVAAEAAA